MLHRNVSMEHTEISFEEFEKAFKILRQKRQFFVMVLTVNFILFEIYKASFEEAVLPEKLKIEKSYSGFKKR